MISCMTDAYCQTSIGESVTARTETLGSSHLPQIISRNLAYEQRHSVNWVHLIYVM